VDVAVVSVICTAAVGLAGLAVTAHGQRRAAETKRSELDAARDEEERRRLEARREDLLAILDEAAKTAMSVRVAASADELGDERVAVEEIRNVVKGAHEHLARLAVRVGPEHELSKRYAEVAQALDNWRAARATLRREGRGSQQEPLVAEEERLANACSEALDRFTAAAMKEIGDWGSGPSRDADPRRASGALAGPGASAASA
jgi:hypothetical protein